MGRVKGLALGIECGEKLELYAKTLPAAWSLGRVKGLAFGIECGEKLELYMKTLLLGQIKEVAHVGRLSNRV